MCIGLVRAFENRIGRFVPFGHAQISKQSTVNPGINTPGLMRTRDDLLPEQGNGYQEMNSELGDI